VTKAKAVLLGRVDRDPHLTGFPRVAVAPGNVLSDLSPGNAVTAWRILPYKTLLASLSGAFFNLNVSNTSK